MDIINTGMSSNGGVQQAASYTPGTKVHSSQDATNPGAPVGSRVTPAQVKDAVGKINDVIQTMAADLKFMVDEETGINVVQVIDNATQEVIRQIPTKEVIKIAGSLDQLQGLLLKRKA